MTRFMASISRNSGTPGASSAVLLVFAFTAACASPQQDQVAAAGQQPEDTPFNDLQADEQWRRNQSYSQRLSELIEQSRNDLASRVNVKAAAITVVEARYVVWPDSSAGCPMPGYEYMQMLTEGVLIRLEAGSRTFHYHSARSGPAFLCEKPAALDPPSRFEEQ